MLNSIRFSLAKAPILIVKRAALLVVASLCLALVSTLSGCGQTGPLYMPTPEQRGEARPQQPATGQNPPSGMLRSQDDAQIQQPTPSVVEPRPGNR
jgi:predicted small lipoprotein YifL